MRKFILRIGIRKIRMLIAILTIIFGFFFFYFYFFTNKKVESSSLYALFVTASFIIEQYMNKIKKDH